MEEHRGRRCDFFFSSRRRHTRFDCDWSSDVCSSDLQGIHYAATPMEAQLCSGEHVIVVGGGNSAGQAAVFLSRTCLHVHVLVRAGGLDRKSVVEGKSGDLGGRRIIKKKKNSIDEFLV